MSLVPGAANFMQTMIYHRCARPFWVYAVTASAASLELLWMVGFLDIEDLVRSIGFSESGADLGRGRRGRRHGGIKLPRAGQGALKTYSALGVRTLLIATIPLEIIGFAILLYHSADKFFYRWSSLLENIACSGTARTLIRSNSDFGVFPNPSGGAISLPIIEADTPVISSGAFSAAVPFGIYEVVLAIEIEGITPSNEQEYTVGITTAGALGLSTKLGNGVTIGPGKGGTSIYQGTVVFPLFSGGTIGWSLFGPAVPVGVSVASCHLIISQEGD